MGDLKDFPRRRRRRRRSTSVVRWVSVKTVTLHRTPLLLTPSLDCRYRSVFKEKTPHSKNRFLLLFFTLFNFLLSGFCFLGIREKRRYRECQKNLPRILLYRCLLASAASPLLSLSPSLSTCLFRFLFYFLINRVAIHDFVIRRINIISITLHCFSYDFLFFFSYGYSSNKSTPPSNFFLISKYHITIFPFFFVFNLMPEDCVLFLRLVLNIIQSELNMKSVLLHNSICLLMFKSSK